MNKWIYTITLPAVKLFSLMLPVVLFLYIVLYYDLAHPLLPYHTKNSTLPESRSTGAAVCQWDNKLNIYYLKVHKTGSTTFNNILARYALMRNLTVAFFRKPHPYPARNMSEYLLFDPAEQLLHINDSVLKLVTEKRQFNMVNVHTVFNYKVIMSFMPKDTVFLATLRHPLSQMISAFYHYKLASRLHMTRFSDPIHEFLSNPAKYDRLLPGSMYNNIAKTEGVRLSFTRHRMAFEFGFDLEGKNDTQAVSNYLKQLSDRFKTVIITERYEESLLLIRKKLCLSYKDILYVILRKQNYREKGVNHNQTYGVELCNNHRQWAILDYQLYDHFLDRHMQEVQKQGDDFQMEIAYFKSLISKVTQYCMFATKQYRISLQIPTSLRVDSTRYHEEFTVEMPYCLLMMVDEGWLRRLLFTKQYPKLCARYKRKLQNLCIAEQQHTYANATRIATESVYGYSPRLVLTKLMVKRSHFKRKPK